MPVEYVRRLRMEFDVSCQTVPVPVLADGYRWVYWNPTLLGRHASVKFASFRSELDSRVFPCLGDVQGCQKLMSEISAQKTFLPEATWLICHREHGEAAEDCGTIQGIARSNNIGAVQNVGVVPEHRGAGLGRALLLKALRGFQQARMRRVYLEVTAENRPAVDLYKSVGFRLTRTMFKAVELEPTLSY